MPSHAQYFIHPSTDNVPRKYPELHMDTCKGLFTLVIWGDGKPCCQAALLLTPMGCTHAVVVMLYFMAMAGIVPPVAFSRLRYGKAAPRISQEQCDLGAGIHAIPATGMHGPHWCGLSRKHTEMLGVSEPEPTCRHWIIPLR